MERDSLLSHGTSFLLKDRLMNCSDAHKAFVCRSCGSILTPVPQVGPSGDRRRLAASCLLCRSGDAISVIEIPYVFRYLTAELAAMNIRIELKVEQSANVAPQI